jgi:hypothetical protein
MFFLYCALISSEIGRGPGVSCPPGTDYHFDATIEVDIPPGGWHYFYTSHIDRPEPLVYQIRANGTVKVYVQFKSLCPDGSVPPIGVALPRKLTKVPVTVPEEANVIVNGLHSVEGAHVQLKLLGQHTPKPINPLAKSGFTFVVMVVITGVYFVKCVLPPLKPKVE